MVRNFQHIYEYIYIYIYLYLRLVLINKDVWSWNLKAESQSECFLPKDSFTARQKQHLPNKTATNFATSFLDNNKFDTKTQPVDKIEESIT